MGRKLIVVFVVGVTVVSTAAMTVAGPRSSRQIERGKYLVERVGMCADCHTPRTERGELDRSKWLQGSELDFQPTHPIPNFASTAPGIAGLPGRTTAEAVRLLETGVTQDGKSLAPPMPQFRMTRSDAAAVVAYLKSLKPAG